MLCVANECAKQDNAAQRSKYRNPNECPGIFMGPADMFGEVTETTSTVFVDVSGSQANLNRTESLNKEANRGTNTIEQIGYAISVSKSIMWLPFGYTFNGSKDMSIGYDLKNHYWPKNEYGEDLENPQLEGNTFLTLLKTHGFPTGTSTTIIEYHIERILNPDKPSILVFQSDGDFTNGKPLSQILSENQTKLGNVKMIILALSPHTTDSDQIKLETSLKEFLKNSNSFIKLKTVKLTIDNPIELRDILEQLPKTTICIPRDYINWDDFSLHIDLTHNSIADELKKTYPHKIPKIIHDLKEIIKNYPELINNENSIYAKLYGALKCLSSMSLIINGKKTTVQEELLDWLSSVKTHANKNSAQYTALNFIMNGSRQDPAYNKWKLYNLRNLPKVGYLLLPFCHSEQFKEALPNAIKDGSCILLMNFIKNLIPKISYSDKDMSGSFGIPDPERCSPEEARSVLSILFQSIGIGQYTLQGAKIYWLAMGLLITEVEIKSTLRAFAERACLDCEAYTYSAIFTDGELRPELFSQPMGYLLFKAITLYGSRMFPESKDTPKHNILVDILKAIYMVSINYERLQRTINTDIKIEREIPTSSTDSQIMLKPKVGSLCQVHPNSRKTIKNLLKKDDPYPGYPSIIRVLSIKKGKAKCEYLDFELGQGKDTCHIVCEYLIVIDYEPTQNTIDYINELLIGYRKICDDASVTWNAKLPKSSNEILKDIMKKIHKNIQTITKKLSVPRDIIKSVLPISPQLRALTKPVYQLTRADIMQFVNLPSSERFAGDAIGNGTFEHEGIPIQLTDIEIKDIIKLYTQDSEFAKNIKGSTVSDMCFCTICQEWVLNTTVNLSPCGHSICKLCNPPHTYGPGELINKVRHVCYCGQVLDPPELEKQFGQEFTFEPNTVYRKCEDPFCEQIVSFELTCGATEEMCPLTCETHRLPSDTKNCPGCNAPTYHNGGCCHMTCRCGTHWCWFCENIFTRQTIYTHMTEDHGGWYL